MKNCADTVAAILANYRKAISFCVDLDHMADIAQMRSWLDLGDTFIKTLLGDLYESFRENTALANDIGFAGVAVIPIFQERHVDINDIAVLEDFFIGGNAMADHMIN